MAYATAAWRFLDAYGYINFGVAPALAPSSLTVKGSDSQGTVIIIGAGLAGEGGRPLSDTCLQEDLPFL